MINIRLIQKYCFLFYLLIIITLSLTPSTFIKMNILWKYDKVIHFFEYLILGFLLLNCFSPSDYFPKLIISILIATFIISGIDEFIIQKFFSKTRNPDTFDWLIDIFGSSSGVFIRYLLRKFLN